MKKSTTLLSALKPFLIALLLQFAAAIYLSILPGILSLFQPEWDELTMTKILTDMDYNAIIMMAFSIFCIACFGIWYYRSCGGDYRIRPRKAIHPQQIFGIVLLVPGTQFAASLLISCLSTLFPKWLEDYENLMENAGMSGEISIFMILYSVCLAPISEELIFRGVMMRIARRGFSFWAANFLQALLFGIFHMNMLQGCYAFALGLILGYVCEKGGTIYLSILLHFLFNLWGTTSDWMNSIGEIPLAILILAGAFFLLPLGLVIFRRGTVKKDNALFCTAE